MADLIDGLAIRRRLGATDWHPPSAQGPDGFAYRARAGDGIVIVTGWYEPQDDNAGWVHASMSRKHSVPTYADMKALHRAVWPNGHAYHVFVPPDEHVNIHERVLHLWGRADGAPMLPNFARLGSI